MSNPGLIPDSRQFLHEAMNTTFTLRLRGIDESAASAMAGECFEQIDYMESRLSRFMEGSDVSRINRMRAGETLYLSETCHQCLLLALNAHAETGGLFDITLGSRIEYWKSGGQGPVPSLAGRLTIHPDVPAVTCEEPGREIDLGGIGKGFALDQLRQLLGEWGADDALLTAGASSMLAFGPSGWPVELTGDQDSVSLLLTNQSLSVSGTGIQGGHIVHPGGPEAMPASPCSRIWVTAPSATLAEIWSTSLMLIELGYIPEFVSGNAGITGVFADREGRVARIC